MMLTSTNSRNYMVQDSLLDETVSVLQNSGLVIFPTDTLWSIGAEATDPVAILRLLRLYQQTVDPYPLEILVDSIQMLKQYTYRLHPKLETLLAYHVHPLSIQVDQPQNLPVQLSDANLPLAFRLVRDSYSKQLIQRLGSPIASMFATFNGNQLPSHFGNINSDVLSAADQVTGMEIAPNLPPRASVMVRLSENDELEFLRE